MEILEAISCQDCNQKQCFVSEGVTEISKLNLNDTVVVVINKSLLNSMIWILQKTKTKKIKLGNSKLL